MNPLRASERIETSYRRYLATTFSPSEPWLREAYQQALAQEFQLTRGPYLQAAAPYARGRTVRELVDAGVLNSAFLRLEGSDALPLDRPLHLHQEAAIVKAVSGRRNLVVATGTGSGKTECFLIPVLDGLFREIDAGTVGQAGVRALLLYPMNALANDQLRRLRRLLAPFPEVTFGRYVGDTKADPKEALDAFRQRFPREPKLRHELLSRQEMQEQPPSILLTNFAMLEYLLLRPRDSALFDGETGRHWRAVALDEAHVYDGAAGAEIAMLLRRVRDRVVGSERGRLQCFATSATLGRGREDFPDLLEYARALFDESFEWQDEDPECQDIVTATRRRLARSDASYTIPLPAYTEINESRTAATLTPATLADLLARHGVAAAQPVNGGVDAALAEVLARDANVVAVQQRLEAGSQEFHEVADAVLGPNHAADLVELVDAAVAGRHGEDDAPVLPARYHFLLRSLEGAFVCFASEHPDASPRFLLTRHESCPACLAQGRKAMMFELGTCRRCGAEYILGSQRLDQLVQAPPYGKLTYLLLSKPASAADEDESDEEEASGDDGLAPTDRYVCPACGHLSAEASVPCPCSSRDVPIRTVVAKPKQEDAPLRRCAACSARSTGEIVGRFLAGADAPVSVIASGVYQELPASSEASTRDLIGEGRKMLVFADSRQDAAFFAPYLERTHRRATQRSLILSQVLRLAREEPPRFEDLVVSVRKRAEESLVIDPEGSRQGNLAEVRTALLLELLAADRRQSLEGTGLLEIALVFPRQFRAPRALLDLGLTEQEAEDLLRMLLDTIRQGAALTTPEGVDIQDDAFAPRNREYGVRLAGSKGDVIAWLPGSGSNRRLDVVAKVLTKFGATADPTEVLGAAWDYVSDPNGIWASVLVGYSDRRHGPLWRLSHERFEFRPLADDHLPGRCARCRQLWWRTVRGVCQTYGCDGIVEPIANVQELLSNHYAALYRDTVPVGMAVQEHTAQWTQEEGGAIQDKFMRGDINVLSCSTTFELGVDVGEVESVLLRNVPPSPANYVQRAGRAGRRLSSAALVVTYAQRRNHDLAYFADPRRMIDGVIAPPRIRVDNPTIVRRHVHAVAFAAFEREVTEHRNVGEFFESVEGAPPASEAFVEWLHAKPAAVGNAVQRVAPPETAEALGLTSWDWVDALVEQSDEDPTRGWLRRASDEVHANIEELEARIKEAADERRFGGAGQLDRQLATLRRTQLLSFLARKNVLPKYGFPVDVVPLDLGRTGDENANKLELDRDLAVAITEYAPGSEIVAAKTLWRSDGLRVQPGLAWPRREWAACKVCGAVRQGLTRPPECAVCGSSEVDGRLSGDLIIPVFGFVGSNSGKRPGDSRPGRGFSSQSYFSEYQDSAPDLELVEDLSHGGVLTHRRSSRQGQITVINRGPGNRGYQVCDRCGYAAPAPIPVATGGRKRDAGHRDIRRPGKKDCTNWLKTSFLGHEYLTDVVEIRTSRPMTDREARSTLYALLEGAARLSIKRDELDGTLYTYGVGAPSAFVIFDTVPGGAGHAQRVGREIADVARAALERVEQCECGPETSCYQCLRSYGNQIWHEELSRGAATTVLRDLLGPIGG